MQEFLKELIQGIPVAVVLPLFYVGAFLALLVTIFRRAEWGVYVMAALIPLTNVRYAFHNFPLGKDFIDIMMLAVALGIFFNKNGFQRARHSWLLIIFVLLNYIALWHASFNFSLPYPISGDSQLLKDWKNYAEMIFLYYLIFNSVQDERQQKILICIMASVLLLINLREFRNFTEGGAFSYDKRVEGPFWVEGLGANHLGAFVAHYSAALVGLYLLDDNRRRRWLYLAAVLFGLHPLFFSYSRGAYVAALISLAFFGLVKKRSLLILLAALFIGWQTLLPTTVVERIEMTESASGELEHSASERVVLWEHAMKLFNENPVFGVGFGAFGQTVTQSHLKDTHNFYMRVLSEEGLLGITLFLLVLIGAFRSGWHLYRLGQSAFHRGLGLGFAGCVLAVMTSNLFGDRWSYFSIGGYFFILWGMVDRGIFMLSREQGPESQPASTFVSTNEKHEGALPRA
jgi:O-antigen ligase